MHPYLRKPRPRHWPEDRTAKSQTIPKIMAFVQSLSNSLEQLHQNLQVAFPTLAFVPTCQLFHFLLQLPPVYSVEPLASSPETLSPLEAPGVGQNLPCPRGTFHGDTSRVCVSVVGRRAIFFSKCYYLGNSRVLFFLR